MSKIQDISYTRLTLSLDIIKKITEGPATGYHELGIVKHQIDLGDTITVESAKETAVVCAHSKVPEDERNICWQAVELMRKTFQIDESLFVTIDKQIPVEGGLAGGSTNAATVLMLCNRVWGLGLTAEELVPLGRKLGMDVPFYFYGKSAFDSEATGVLKPIATDMSLVFVLIVPPFGVSTASAYGAIDYSAIGQRTAQTENVQSALEIGSISLLSQSIHNDFELSVFTNFPALAEMKKELYNQGALAAFMSGSGSTMVALVEDYEHAKRIQSMYETTFIARSL